MKRFIATIFVLGAMSTVSFAATTLNCKSANYIVVVSDIEGNPLANYGINGTMNDGADVEIEKLYLSQNVIALSLKVDGQPSKFEIAVTQAGNEKYKGLIFEGKNIQQLTCTRR